MMLSGAATPPTGDAAAAAAAAAPAAPGAKTQRKGERPERAVSAGAKTPGYKGREGFPAASGRGTGGAGRGDKGEAPRGRRQKQPSPEPPADLGLDNFPALPGSKPAAEGIAPKAGEYIKFDRELFARIISEMGAFSRPEGMSESFSTVFRKAPLEEARLTEPMPV